MTHPTLITVKDAAKQTASPPRSVYNWIRQGFLVGHKLGRSVRVDQASVDRFVLAGRMDVSKVWEG